MLLAVVDIASDREVRRPVGKEELNVSLCFSNLFEVSLLSGDGGAPSLPLFLECVE